MEAIERNQSGYVHFFLCTDQLQVYNNKHPPTQKKKKI